MIANIPFYATTRGAKKAARSTTYRVEKWHPRTEGHRILTPGNIDWISGK